MALTIITALLTALLTASNCRPSNTRREQLSARSCRACSCRPSRSHRTITRWVSVKFSQKRSESLHRLVSSRLSLRNTLFPCKSWPECFTCRCTMLQKSCKSDFSTFPAARNHQPPVRVSAIGRQRIGNGLQGRQCCTAVFAGRYIIPD